MNSEQQLELWVQGNSVHNREHDHCCPDFSCCFPELAVDLDVRQRFARAINDNEIDVINHMLQFFYEALQIYQWREKHEKKEIRDHD